MEPIVIGSTYRWFPSFYKDGAQFTPTTITINFRSPTNVLSSFSMTVSGNTGLYTNLTTLFTAAGQWNRSYTLTEGGIVLQSKGITFKVYPSVSAGF